MGFARMVESLGNWLSDGKPRPVSSTNASEDGGLDKVGDFDADYDPVSLEEIAEPTPEMDALIARSTVVSAKRL